jgi:hypothetical protein
VSHQHLADTVLSKGSKTQAHTALSEMGFVVQLLSCMCKALGLIFSTITTTNRKKNSSFEKRALQTTEV